MEYSKLQKYTSFLIVFVFLFSLTVKMPLFDFLGKAKAQNKEFVNLVSVIVNEDIYSGVSANIERYAKDIQGVLENTRVVILPVPSDVKPFEISSLNESLYFEGYNGLSNVDFESRLVGTVLVGELPVAIVSANNKTTKSIIPYTDFVDKAFIYDHDTELFEENKDKQDSLSPEIWHGVISPNGVNQIEAINNYFDKNHDYYAGTGNFKNDFGILNGVNTENPLDEYKPYVFYFDQFREQKAIHYPAYKGYKGYLDNREDLAYNRYSKGLAKKIEDEVLGAEKDEYAGLIDKIDNPLLTDAFSKTSGPNTDSSTDIASRKITKATVKKFAEIFNKGQLSDFRTNVHNAGRYNADGSQVNMDMIPYLITILDVIADEMIKKANTDIENYIDKMVMNGLSTKLALPTKILVGNGLQLGPDWENYGNEYTNFLHGHNAKYIKYASGCTIFRGSTYNSGTLVEANRGINVKHVEADVKRCKKKTSGRWGYNSPLNLNLDKAANGELVLNPNARLDLSVTNLYDIVGSKKDEDPDKNPSPLNCFDTNFIATDLKYFGAHSSSFKINFDSKGNPTNGVNWRCQTNMETKQLDKNNIDYRLSFDELLLKIQDETFDNAMDCIKYGSELILDGNTHAKSSYEFENLITGKLEKLQCQNVKYKRYFKSIDSYMFHKSPTAYELINQIKNPYSPNLPIDKDRYVDFLGNDGEYKKIIYPNLFRSFYFGSGSTYTGTGIISMDDIKNSLEKYLSGSTQELNELIKINDPEIRLQELNILKEVFGGIDEIMDIIDGFGLDDEELSDLDIDNIFQGITEITDIIDELKIGSGALKDTVFEGAFDGISEIEELLKLIKDKEKEAKDGSLEDDELKELFGDIFDLKEKTDDTLSELEKLFADNPEILKIIKENNGTLTIDDFGSLKDFDKYIYDLMKTGEYKFSNQDLIKYLQERSDEMVTIMGEEKHANLYDFIIFSIYWKNLNNTSAKYKFIIEHYLSDQFGGNDFDFLLPKNKKLYEMAYLGGVGDTQNMYIKMNPEAKGDNPYGDIMASNALLDSSMVSFKTMNGSNKLDIKDGEFKCAPPEGVPIWEWLPAVICRVNDMLPAKIGISESDCGASFLEAKDIEEIKEFEEKNNCKGDLNKDGINDCIALKLGESNLEIKSDKGKYYYGSAGKLNIKLFDAGDKQVFIDNASYVQIELDSIKDNETGDIVFDGKKDKYKDKINDINRYINFKPGNIRLNHGEASYGFAVKGIDSEIGFKAIIQSFDKDGNEKFLLKSDIIKINVSSDRLFLGSSIISDGNILYGESKSKANSSNNVYIYDATKEDISNFKEEGKIALSLSNKSKSGEDIEVSYPINIKVEDEFGKIIEETDISNLSGFIPLFGLKKIGFYNILLEDAEGYIVKKEIEILPNEPAKIDVKLGTNVIEKGGTVTTNVVTIYDNFDNPVIGKFLDLEMKFVGSNLEFLENSKSNIKYRTYEGFKAFRTISKNDSGIERLQINLFQDGVKLLSESKNIKVIDKMSLNIEKNEDFKVGNNSYKLKIKLNGIDDFNSRLYLNIDKKYGYTKKSYYEIVDGEVTIDFNTNILAGKKIPFEFQIEGLNGIHTEYYDILPGDAMKISLDTDNPKMEAADDSKAIINVELKDIYGNVVFTDNKTEIKVELQDKYKNIIVLNNKSKIVKEGKAKINITGTQHPGMVYIKFTSSPDLSSNTVELEGQAPFLKEKINSPLLIKNDVLFGIGKKLFYEIDKNTIRSKFNSLDSLLNNDNYKKLPDSLKNKLKQQYIANNKIVINGVGENAIKFDTFYFWNESKIINKKYNSLYTVLLGSSYGDYTQKGYLAGGLLFDKNNRSLAVTSLLNDPHYYNDIINISKDANIKKVYNKLDLTQDILLDLKFDKDNKAYLDIFNDTISTYIGKIYFNFSSNNNLVDCSDKCDLNDSKTNIYVKPENNGVEIVSTPEKIIVKNKYKKILFSVEKNGKINKKSGTKFVLSDGYGTNTEFDVMLGKVKIATLGFKFNNSEVKIAKNQNVVSGLLSTSDNNVIVSILTKEYGVRETYSNKGEIKYSIYYNDPFAKKGELNSFARDNLYSFDAFNNKKGIGWKDGNKAMLEFASGKGVGEAVKNYSSVGVINLGDPVIFLKKIRKTIPNTNVLRNFDSTIGKKINNKPISTFRVFDYNNDGNDDILIVKKNKFLKIIENKDISGTFLNQRNIANIVDLGNEKLIQAGDFSGDGYDDIFFVNNKGKPYLLNNTKKDFNRIDLESQFGLRGVITLSRGFDMDNDGKMDIVTMDSAGEINIFYGGGTSDKPSFTKKLISSGHGIKLNGTPRNDMGILYFDGLYQTQKDKAGAELLASSSAFNNAMNDAIKKLEAAKKSGNNNAISIANKKILDLNDSKIDEGLNDKLIDPLVFVELSYNTGAINGIQESDASIEDQITELAAKIEGASTPEIKASLELAKTNLEELLLNNTGSISNIDGNPTFKTTFIRSQYAKTQGIEITRTLTDKNGGFLEANDIIVVKLSIKNVSGSIKKNIAYLEDIAPEFILDYDSIKSSFPNLQVKKGIDGYKFLFEKFDLGVGDELVINYGMKSRALKYGYIDVGLFEKGEAGDDDFGDILFKANEKNCGDEKTDIFRSSSARSYEKGEKELECDSDKLKLPDPLDKNAIDNDGNGVPDYIDKLTKNPPDIDALEKYSKDTLENLYIDTDGDGIPDNEDIMPSIGDNVDSIDMANTEELYNNFSQGVDEFMQGFGCGFGGGSCISSPLNWAPLAPGNDPVVLGKLVGDGLKVTEGLPIFGFPTVGPVNVLGVPVPPVWPTNYMGAGGRLGVGGPFSDTPSTSVMRFFVTPTITGAVGTAFCMGPNALGYFPPMGFSPIIGGGNCIVTAKPFFGCSGGGSNGDPESMGITNNYAGTNFGMINGNCGAGSKNKFMPSSNKLDMSFMEEYMKYKKTGQISDSLRKSYKSAMDDIFSQSGGGPLFDFGGGDGENSVDIDMNLSELADGNFQDVIEFSNTRISPFPAFLMDWATRQLEEIITKLTDFPTVMIIYPDFTSLFNGDWNKRVDKDKKTEDDKKKERQDKLDKKIDRLIKKEDDKKDGKNCEKDDWLFCQTIDQKIRTLEARKGHTMKKVNSGIRGAFEFLSSVPFVTIDPEKVSINVPWVDGTNLDKTINSRKATITNRKAEIKRAGEAWSLGSTCDTDECHAQNDASEKITLDISQTIRSIEQNIAALEEYKRFPEKLATLINKKQDRLEQVLCNIETISEIMNGWIGKNGIRFKAWVETYVLIKAILKSWQALADVFIDYEAECHECKNERHDSLGGEFELISFIIPQIPVIQFPKWPDIILDLHNIRANLKVVIPDFDINLRPIVLPDLPELYLPEVPNINIVLPKIPILPVVEIPELPDIPALPKIELPNLPPPPNLPKLFPSIDGVIDILKLVTKAMCVLKKSPFVPEWRAGDQIAFLTERSGYLDFDFLDVALPNFTYPFVDAIRVTTYVNLEFETEFLVEMARTVTTPLNSMTSNMNHLLDFSIEDFDFRGTGSSEIDVKLDGGVSYNDIKGKLDKIPKKSRISMFDFSRLLGKGILNIYNYIDKNKDKTLSNSEIISNVNRSLARYDIVNDPAFDEVRNVWKTVNKMNYTKEDKKIEELLRLNKEKFDTVKQILNIEKVKNKKLLEKIKTFNKPKIALEIASETKSDFEYYNSKLDKYNNIFSDSFNNNKLDEQNSSLERLGNQVASSLKTGFEPLKRSLDKNTLLSAVAEKPEKTPTENTCSAANNSDYKYNYKGIYIVEDDGSYLLFDYLDELDGKEKIKLIDYDLDNDKDLLYLSNGDLYLKENLTEKSTKNYITDSPLFVTSSANKFVNKDIYYESVNNVKELTVSVGAINLKFNASNNKSINNYRLEYYTIIDKYLNKGNDVFIPEKIAKNIVDAIAGEEDNTLLGKINNKEEDILGDISEIGEILDENNNDSDYEIRNNVGYYSHIGELPGIELKTKTKINLNDEISSKKILVISAGSRIYTTNSAVTLIYLDGKDKKFVEIAPYSNLLFKKATKLIGAVGGNIFTFTDAESIITGSELVGYINMPVLFGDNLYKKSEGSYSASSHVDISYYDKSKLSIDFRETDSFRLYDLGNNKEDYLIRVNLENDYLYSRIKVFKNNIEGTYSKQVLLSPQIEADKYAPDFNFNGPIRIPVYLEKKIDFTQYIYDDGGIEGLKEVKIEGLDSSTYNIEIAGGTLRITFGPYENLLKKKIKMSLTDMMGNKVTKDLDFEVYAPIPEISDYTNAKVNGNIDEALTGEPINLYRLRGGGLQKLSDAGGQEKVMTNAGKFMFNIEDGTGGAENNIAIVKQNGVDVIKVNEKTGKIELLDPSLSISSKQSIDGYPEIGVFNNAGQQIFYEKIKIDEVDDIELVDSFIDKDKPDLYIKIMDKQRYDYYKIPKGVPYNPGATVIFSVSDSTKKPLFTIFKDGRIKPYSSNYIFEYSTFKDNVIFKLKDKYKNIELARIMYLQENGLLIK